MRKTARAIAAAAVLVLAILALAGCGKNGGEADGGPEVRQGTVLGDESGKNKPKSFPKNSPEGAAGRYLEAGFKDDFEKLALCLVPEQRDYLLGHRDKLENTNITRRCYLPEDEHGYDYSKLSVTWEITKTDREYEHDPRDPHIGVTAMLLLNEEGQGKTLEEEWIKTKLVNGEWLVDDEYILGDAKYLMMR